jgi:hypothetical protein
MILTVTNKKLYKNFTVSRSGLIFSALFLNQGEVTTCYL